MMMMMTMMLMTMLMMLLMMMMHLTHESRHSLGNDRVLGFLHIGTSIFKDDQNNLCDCEFMLIKFRVTWCSAPAAVAVQGPQSHIHTRD